MPIRRRGGGLAPRRSGLSLFHAPCSRTVPEPGAGAQRLLLLFDAYNFSPAEAMTLDVAEDLLVRDCMLRRGLAWQALPAPA
ncbi:hypothetical protein [Nonomuraea longicatena]|uniref:Uncharacterized protein n=1 Tax=Nonomuraea longicatena TaxID=83682 RepID=A0ABN1Q7D7_9ACTN